MGQFENIFISIKKYQFFITKFFKCFVKDNCHFQNIKPFKLKSYLEYKI